MMSPRVSPWSTPPMRAAASARRGLQSRVAAGVLEVLVRVQDLGDLPAALARGCQAQLPLQRIHGERLAALRAGNEIVKIPPGVTRPDALREHRTDLLLSLTCNVPYRVTRAP